MSANTLEKAAPIVAINKILQKPVVCSSHNLNSDFISPHLPPHLTVLLRLTEPLRLPAGRSDRCALSLQNCPPDTFAQQLVP